MMFSSKNWNKTSSTFPNRKAFATNPQEK